MQHHLQNRNLKRLEEYRKGSKPKEIPWANRSFVMVEAAIRSSVIPEPTASASVASLEAVGIRDLMRMDMI